ncbi:MAG: hypothetical protein P1U56_05830 [Saprospiraceae bacterium]|nr:hypothetical protein [Saprospiraceae bacterium]
MGWDTEIVILAEHCQDTKQAIQISKQIKEKDAYGPPSVFVNDGKNLFYHYERRKAAPYWVIKEISQTHQDVCFTILASCPDFVGGPGGIIRIQNGEIIDSYGIGELNIPTIRIEILIRPLHYIPLIFNWFKWNGSENDLRMKFCETYPLGWSNDRYADKLIPIEDTKELKILFSKQYHQLEDFKWKKVNL